MDKAKLFAAAEKAVVKGQYDKALEQFESILRVDPQDTKALNRAADIYLKKGDNQKGIQALHNLAQAYTKDGFYSKAVAIYKRVLKIENIGTKEQLVEVYEKLADLYGQLGLISDAMAHYSIVVDIYDRLSNHDSLLEVLKKVSDLDPYNIDSQLKLAELFIAQKRDEEANDSLDRLFENVSAKDHTPDILRVLERWVELVPGNYVRLKDLVDRYLKVGEPKKALARIQLAFKADPRATEVLELLAATFQELKQPDKAKAVLVELLKIYREKGQAENAANVENRIQGKAPVFEAPAASSKPENIASDESDAGDALIESLSLDPDERKVLAECEVYLKYGLSDKAYEVLSATLARFSQSLALRWRLKSVALDRGQNDQAAHLLSEVILLAKTKNLNNWIKVATDELRRVDPAHATLGGVGSPAKSNTTQVEDIDFQNFEPSEISIVLEEEIAPSEESASQNSESYLELKDDSAVQLDHDISFSQPIEDSEGQKLDIEFDLESDDAPQALLTEDDFSEDELNQLQKNLAPNESSSISLTDDEAPLELLDSSVPATPSPTPPLDPDFEIRQALEEFEFFRQQGLMEDANQLIQKLNLKYPGHPQLMKHAKGSPEEKLKKRNLDLEALGRKVKMSVQEDTRSSEDENFVDLAKELGEELADERAFAGPTEVKDVFNAFKAGVAQAVSEEDWQTHHDLGVAYREMGLIDDAIQEFKLVQKNPAHETSALYQIGVCEMARQNFGPARDYFDQALKNPKLMGQEKISITYELADALLNLNDKKRARALFEEVQKIDPEFREIREKLQGLAS